MTPRPLEVVVRAGAGGFAVRRIDRGVALLGMRLRPRPATLTETDTGAVLVTPDRSVYLRLGPEERHIWSLLDGRATVAEIATAYFIRFGSLHVSKVTRFIHVLRQAGLVEVVPAGFLRRRFEHTTWLRRELTWDGMHALASAVHRGIGPMFTWWNLPLLVAVLGLGVASAVIDARPDPAGDLAMAGWLALGLLLNVAVHEIAHAVAVVAFGRQVRGAAIGWRGVYVDTTDMYLGTRAQHAVVAMAGPAMNLVVLAAAATIACALPVEVLAPLRGLERGALVVLVCTGWPFLLDNDATHALSDLTGVPDLRRAAWDGLRRGRLGAAQAAYVFGTVATVLAAPLWLYLSA